MSKRFILTLSAMTLACVAFYLSYKVRPLEKTEVDLIKALLLTASAYIVAETHRKS